MEHNQHNDTMNMTTDYMPEHLQELYAKRQQIAHELGVLSSALTVANVNYNAAVLESIKINGAIITEERRLAAQ